MLEPLIQCSCVKLKQMIVVIVKIDGSLFATDSMTAGNDFQPQFLNPGDIIFKFNFGYFEGDVVVGTLLQRIALHHSHPDIVDEEKLLIRQRKIFPGAVVNLPRIEHGLKKMPGPLNVFNNDGDVT